MKVEDVKTVAEMVALDHNTDPKIGCEEAKQHTLDHLRVVPQHCYVIENNHKEIIAAMVLHHQEKVFEIEDFYAKDIQRNREALALLKAKLLEYLENTKTEILCCPYALRRLIVET